MFQLIVAVIAIALVIALTLASIFYGGEAFTRSSLKANVAAMVNQAQQISGAHTLYKTDYSRNAADINTLVTDGYLADTPVAPKIVKQDEAWAFSADHKAVTVILGDEPVETCKAVELNGVGECQVGGASVVAADIVSGDEVTYAFKL